jgi:NADH-quinone oxidoreductase subunit E
MVKRQKKVVAKAADDGRVDQIIDKYEGKASLLIQALLEIQKETRWLSKEILEKVSKKLDVPLSKVQHTATFYKAFNVIPEGRHEVHVCNGTSCHVHGSSRILGKVQEMTGIEHGETDPDFKFSLKAVTCLGCCASGPGMVVDGEYHDKMDPAKAADVLKNCD